MRYYLIAGEASGDLHASNLMKAIKNEDNHAEFRFYGGDKMEAVGGRLVQHYKNCAYMGFVPVLMHLRTIFANMDNCKRDIEQWRPDVLILVDYPGFNLKIAKFVHEKGICPIHYYISPKIWAWKEGRIKAIRKYVDELYSILPFEVKWFKDRNYDVHYVGNPCVDAIHGERATATDIDSSHQIAILCGSRKQEIKDNLSIMLKAVSHFPDYRAVIAGAPNIDESFYHKFIPRGSEVEIRFGQTYDILRHSAAALVTSGTATLETAIIGVPQIVCYYAPMGWFFRVMRKLFLKVKYISLVNLIADKEIVPELVLDAMNVKNVRHLLTDLLPGGNKRDKMIEDYKVMNNILGGPGASERAAKLIVKKLKENQ